MSYIFKKRFFDNTAFDKIAEKYGLEGPAKEELLRLAPSFMAPGYPKLYRRMDFTQLCLAVSFFKSLKESQYTEIFDLSESDIYIDPEDLDMKGIIWAGSELKSLLEEHAKETDIHTEINSGTLVFVGCLIEAVEE